MRQSRRNFIKTAGCLTIGFCLGGPSFTWPSPSQSLPGDLRENPHINAWLEILADGRVRVLTGKIELGQGIRTAVAQMAAEELNLDMSQVEVTMAETGVTPDEGYTAGSNSIEMSAVAIRYAAAAAKQRLLLLAAEKWGVPATGLVFTQGKVSTTDGGHTISLAQLLDGRQITDEVRMPVTLKPKEQHQLVGKAVPREDNIRIVYGQPVYVQDLTFPGMLHGRVVRPPGYGAQLLHFDEQAAKSKSPGLLKTVVSGSFLAVIADNEYHAIRAQQAAHAAAKWSAGPPLPNLQGTDLATYIKTLPVQPEKVAEKGDLSTLPNGTTIKATYFKPYIMHGSIGPSCAVARYDNNKLEIWTHSQGVYPLRETLADFLHLPAENIHIKGTPGSGCYGHNGADDVAADAALLAMALPGKHIHLQWSRDDEHAWEPYGSAMIMELEAAMQPSGNITHWKYTLWSDTHGTRPGGQAANLLAAHYIANPVSQRPSGFSGGAHRNAEPYYAIPNQRVDANFFNGPLRTSSLRSLGAYANLFAIESFMDELAASAGKDPYEFRLLNLDDDRAKAVLRQLQQRTSTPSSTTATATTNSTTPNQHPANSTTPDQHPANTKTATGIAFSRYKNAGTYCAIAARVSVDTKTGNVRVQKMWAVIDAGEVINLDGLKNQIEGGMVQSASWTLFEQVKFNEKHITSRDWTTYPIMHIDQAPELEVTVIDRPQEQPFGAGEAAQGPAAAAIVNAIYHACGKRIRHLPVGSINISPTSL
ncbi:xanthine dehydrogenase family protein molybdopterin-binding subunit [Puia dinghuensis]|uniref:Aldehyde dehydrogenase n=1 Tax=Puia dinghuensis TaxID=1792502 RepID=A0A8J2UHD6_9BACT|nr:molybdopterin cofactor-binding domain-containing protein [Puia dinghuensis]GGB18206.1 aldehyde dehydrogenase [Puia dinghuensis]